MNVSIKSFDVEMVLKNNGIELEIRTTANEHLGDVVLNKTGVIWCRGRTLRTNGVYKSWEELIAMFEGNG